MLTDTLLLTALFSLAAVAIIGVLNAQGFGRTLVAALLAVFCLGAALWGTVGYRAARMVAATEAPAQNETSGNPVESDLPVDGEVGMSTSGTTDPTDLADLAAATRRLRDSMDVEDPARARAFTDSEYQAFESRAGEYLTRARMLRERAARVAAAPPSGLEESAEFLTLSLQALNAAARDLQAFFRASDRNEEQRLMTAFRRGMESANAPLRSAESRLGAASTARPEFEGLER
jgi:hypothetical protein